MRDENGALYLTGPDGTDWPVPVTGGFRQYVLDLGRARFPADVNAGILSLFGYPAEPEWLAQDGRVYQRFERSVLQWNPGEPPPWDIVQLREDDPIPPPRLTGA
jgi:hypothetical protein